MREDEGGNEVDPLHQHADISSKSYLPPQDVTACARTSNNFPWETPRAEQIITGSSRQTRNDDPMLG